MRSLALLALAAAASALPSSTPMARRQENDGAATRKLLVASSSLLQVFDFDGTSFKSTAEFKEEGFNPSWVAFKEPNLIYSVNENADDSRLFTYDAGANSIKQVQTADSSTGVVHLEFNKDKTRMVGAGFTNGTVDAWDISAEDGQMKLLTTVQLDVEEGASPDQDGPMAHQTVLDPSGRFFAVNDWGANQVHILDSADDAWKITNCVGVDAGCAPRHGSFFPKGAAVATHYLLVCETSNELVVFGVDYNADTGMGLTQLSKQSTYGPDGTAPEGSAAGELVLSADSVDVYVTNRIVTETGTEPDNVAHFVASGVVGGDSKPDAVTLEFKETSSVAGDRPRGMALSTDESFVFVGNQDGTAGRPIKGKDVLVALPRNAGDGSLGDVVASLDIDAFGGEAGQGFGVEFVQELPSGQDAAKR